MDRAENSSQDLRSIPIGTTLSDYRIEGVLGQGSFGITYLATDMMLNRKVAIKEYFPREFAARDGTLTVRAAGNREDRDNFLWGLDSFLKEARVLALFDHPNIVPVRRFFEANGTAYLVMDYCDGTPLDELIKNIGPISQDKFKKLVVPILDALELIHKSNFLHRDLKPANIFIKSDGTPVLLDFGAARQDLVSHSKSVTSLATPGYGAIEQYSTHGNQGPWTDIYGFGATLYRAITGNKPDDATDRLLDDKLIPAATLGAGKFSDETLKAIDTAISVRPENRPKSISDWKEMFGSELKDISFVKNNIDLTAESEKTVSVKPKIDAESNQKYFKKADTNKNKLLIGGLVAIIFLSVILAFFMDKKDQNVASTKEPVSPVALPAQANNSTVDSKKNDISKPGQPTPLPDPKRNEQKANVPLPSCEGENVTKWNNCQGYAIYPKQEKDTHQSNYIGEFRNGLPDGKGKSVNGVGSTYEGDFKAGKRHGTGTITTTSGFKYSGGWIDDLFSGNGSATFPNGDKYVGQFSKGMANGRGTYSWVSGQKYVGGFINDKKSGQGTLTYADGRKYVGNFLNDVFEGQGSYYDEKGTIVYSGLWENGKAKSSSSASSANSANTSSTGTNSALQQCVSYATKTKQQLNLPKAVDNITIATDIFCIQGNPKPVFIYKYDVNSSEGFGQKLLDTQLREKNKKIVCDTDLKLFLPIVDIEYQYYYSSNPSNFNPKALIGKLRYTESDCTSSRSSVKGNLLVGYVQKINYEYKYAEVMMSVSRVAPGQLVYVTLGGQDYDLRVDKVSGNIASVVPLIGSMPNLNSGTNVFIR